MIVMLFSILEGRSVDELISPLCVDLYLLCGLIVSLVHSQ